MIIWGIFDSVLYRYAGRDTIQKKRGIKSQRILEINEFFDTFESDDKEKIEVAHYIRRKGLNTVFPYQFARNYEAIAPLRFKYDKYSGLYYGNEKYGRIYFKQADFDSAFVYYHELICEQDKNSPHLYTERDISGDYLFDIGAAEGIFSLKCIRSFKKCFLVEGDKEWIKPLEKTFSGHIEKTVIINSYAGMTSDDHTITIDDIVSNYHIKQSNIVVKVDVEGMEMDVLKGMSRLLSEGNNVTVLVCTYHKENDESDIKDYFSRFKGFEMEMSRGYMILYYDERIKPPYLRRGVLRAYKH